jgi:hypothetical protein
MTSTKLGMERIIYKTNLIGLNILPLIIIGIALIAIISGEGIDTVATDYQFLLEILGMCFLYLWYAFKRFILTENEFIVEYPPLAFILKPKRIPLNDIEKLVFKQGRGQALPQIEICRVNKEQSTRLQFFTASDSTSYSFSPDYDDAKRLIAALKSNGVQVECIGVVWGKGGLLKQLWKKTTT